MKDTRKPRALRQALVLAAITFACLFGALSAAADDTEIQTVARGEAGSIDLETAEGAIQLSLDDAITRAMQRNLGLVVERYRRSQSLASIIEQMGIYDLNLDATVNFSDDSRPTSSTLEAAAVVNNETVVANFGLDQLTRWGGTASIDFNNSRFTSSDLFVQPNPSFRIDLDAIYQQPLLRNFGRLPTERNLIVARTNSTISREDFRIQVEAVIQQVSDAYWNLVEAREQLAVANESLDLAEELHEMNRIQVEVGTMAPLEMVQSEVGVATREEDIIRFQAAVGDAADLLRQLLNLDRGPLWDTPIEPVTDPAVVHQAIDVKAAVETALDNRPELESQRLRNEIRRLDAQVARNQLKPRLDLQLIYSLNAIDGDVVIPDQGIDVQAGYEDAFDQITGIDFDGWQAGAVFAYPLQNRAARSRLTQAELLLEQGDVELRDLEQGVLTDVRRTARAVETAAKQIESAQVSSKLAMRNLEAEQKRYENGLSTSFQVLEIQEDLSSARQREVSAVIAYRIARVAFFRAMGTLLDEVGVVLSDDGGDEAAKEIVRAHD